MAFDNTIQFPAPADARVKDFAGLAAGTMIATIDGLRAVEDLRPGDLLMTRESGYQPVLHCEVHRVTAAEIETDPNLAPVRIEKGGLGHDRPDAPLTMTASQRVLHVSAMAELLFADSEVLVPASALGPVAQGQSPDEGMTYVQVHCAAHEIISANGLWTETVQPDAQMDTAMTAAHPVLTRSECLALVG